MLLERDQNPGTLFIILSYDTVIGIIFCIVKQRDPLGQLLGNTLAEVGILIEWNGAEQVFTVHDHNAEDRVFKHFHIDACFSNGRNSWSLDHVQSNADTERDISQIYQITFEGLEVCDFHG